MIFLLLEKIKKKIKNNIATRPNLKEREKKGDALSTIILLVMKADDQRITKSNGTRLLIFISLYLRFIYALQMLFWFFDWTFKFQPFIKTTY